MNVLSLIVPVIVLFSLFMTMSENQAHGLDMDVKCTIYENDNVDVRIYVLGLKANSFYTAEIVPDNNPAIIITGETDSQGIFWVVAKIQSGENDSIFRVILHEGKNASGHILIQGEDRKPCHQILTSE